ncbi:MAG: hypothetical protein HQK79_21505 [Desulfobacterales bacterium]|nr:hypothetical protein [Desulfobacterales bacterium]
MRLIYHVMMDDSFIAEINKWEKICNDFGFEIKIYPQEILINLSKEVRNLKITYKKFDVTVSINTAPISDVKDICDELLDHISCDQNISVDISIDAKQNEIYVTSIAVFLLTKLTNGVCYIEGDGAFVIADEAIENAQTIKNNLSIAI